MRRIISIFLCITAIASMAVTGWAENSGFNKNMKSGDIRLLSAVGIIDENDEIFETEEVYISRGEMARLLVCTMGYSKIAGGLTEFKNLYKDVNLKTKYAREIIFSTELGLFGDEISNYFYPEASAEADWAIDAMARLLGYSIQMKSEPLIGYRIGIGDDISKTKSGFLKREDAIQLLINALEIPLFRVKGVVNSYVIYDQSVGRSLLSEYFGVEVRKGCLTADKYIAVKGERCGDDEIAIDGIVYSAENLETKDMVGMMGRFYIKDTGDMPTVVYMEKLKSKEVMLYSKNMEYSYEKNCYYTDKNGKTEEFRMNIETMVAYNGLPHFDKAKMLPLAGHVVLIDNDTDGIYEVCKISEYTNAVVKSCDVLEKRIFDLTDSNRNIIFDDYDEVVIYGENGEETDISKIIPGNVLTVYKSIDLSRLEIFVTSGNTSRYLEKINTLKETVTLDGEEHRISDDCLFNPVDLRAGQIYSVYINYWNEIVYIRENASYFAIWFLKAAQDGVMDESVQIKGLSETGEMLRLSLAKRVVWNTYNSGKERIEEDEAYKRLMPGGVPDKQMFKMALNEAGEVCEIVVAYDALTRADLNSMTRDYPLIRMSYIINEWPDYALYRIDAGTGAKYTYFYGDNFNQWLYFDSNAVEFHVETNATRGSYSDEDMGVRKFRYRSTDQRDISTFDVYMSGKNHIAADYIVKDLDDPKEQSLLTEGYFNAPGIVSDIENCIDEKTGEFVTKLSICDRTGWITEVLTTSESVVERAALISAGAILPDGKNRAEVGDIVSYELDKNGKIDELRLVYDARNNIGTYPQSGMDVCIGCNYGYVLRSKNGYMEYSAEGGGITTPIVLSSNIGRFLVEYDKETKKTRAITADEVYDGDRVVVLSRFASPYMVVVFREE